MTEKEKMLAGQLYFSPDPQLMAERKAAKELLYDYNHLRPAQLEKRAAILKQLLGSIREAFCIEPPFQCDFGSNIHIGSHFYANVGCVMLDCANITIGNHVYLAPNVHLYTVNHAVNIQQRDAGYEYAQPITICDHVWIGGNTTILPGVTIGENSIIGAGSVVTKDIPPNVTAAGNPCRMLKPLTKEELGIEI